MNDKSKSISERLRILRLSNRLTQEEMANKFFLSRSCWANYERGIRVPSCDLLMQISKQFNVEIGYLINGENSVVPNKEIANFKLLSKDWKLDISTLSVSHKMMIVEICRCLISGEDDDNKSKIHEI